VKEEEECVMIREVLDYRVLLDLRNILRQQMGMRAASGPAYYLRARCLRTALVTSFDQSATLFAARWLRVWTNGTPTLAAKKARSTVSMLALL
jgi:hypothetical protein